jgi:hypothetical protein
MSARRIFLTALAAAALIAGSAVAPAQAATIPPVTTFPITKCNRLLSPDAAGLMGAPGILVSDSGTTTPTVFGSRLVAVRNIVAANGGRTCVWRFGTTTVTMSYTGVTKANRVAIDSAWWTIRGIDGINTGGASTIYHTAVGGVESGYLIGQPYYLTATSTDGTYFPAFVQLQASHFVTTL